MATKNHPLNWNAWTAVIAIFGFLALQTVLEHQLRLRATPTYEPVSEDSARWHPKLFEILSFGHLPLAVDWLWMKTLQDPAITPVGPHAHPRAYYDLNLATDLDPAYFEVYTAGANLLAVIRSDGAGARDLLLKGRRFLEHELPRYQEEFKLRHWGSSWNIPLLLAYVYLFELNDMPHAAEAFQQAAELPRAPTYLQSLSARLSKPGGSYEVGIRLLNFMISGQEVEALRLPLEEKRNSLIVGQYLFHLNDGFLSYLKANSKYRQSDRVSRTEMETYWRHFQRDQRLPSQDPWGGRLSVSENGRIVTTTVHKTVFGLE